MSLPAKVARSIRERIAEGAYAFRKFPGEKELAREFGVSYMTARQAVLQLIDEKVVARRKNGRTELLPGGGGRTALNVVLLTPAFESGVFSRWRHALNAAAGECGATVRLVNYVHWDDALFWDALTGFDGAFVMASTEPMPPRLAERMAGLPRKPFFLEHDYSGFGLPSIVMFAAGLSQLVLDHLADLGHERIACVNTQPEDGEVRIRIAQWRMWMASRGVEAPLVNVPVRPYQHPLDESLPALRRGLPPASDYTAAFCVTCATAAALYRVLHERGLAPGRDVSVATLDGEGMAAALVPSLTAMDLPDLRPPLRLALDWMRSPEPWTGPLALPCRWPKLVARESTTAPAHRRSERRAAALATLPAL